MTEFTLTTKQLSEDLGISSSLVHKLKSENPEALTGHWTKTDMNVLLWSESAKAVIESIRNNGVLIDNKETLTELPDAPVSLTLEGLAEDFDRAFSEQAKQFARQRVQRRFERLVEVEEAKLIRALVNEASETDDLEPVLDRWLDWHESTSQIRALAMTNGNGNGRTLALSGN